MNDRLSVIMWEYIFQKEAYYKNKMIACRNRLMSKHCCSNDVVDYLLACRDYELFCNVFTDISDLLKLFN